jgi:hypothetical protein
LGYVPAYHTQFAPFFNEKAPGCFILAENQRQRLVAAANRLAGKSLLAYLLPPANAFSGSLFPEGHDLPCSPARPSGPGNQGAFYSSQTSNRF